MNFAAIRVHPVGLAGCTLVANPEVVVLTMPVNGVVIGNCRFADSPVWAGTVVHHQFVQGAFDPAFTLLSLSSSNELASTIGSY